MLKLQEFIMANADWKEKLVAAPYSLKIQTKDNLVLFKYNQVGSDFSLPEVCEARGIILERDTWRVVRKAFNKFFNLGERFAADIDWSTASATMKEDGSLISLYYYNDSWQVATNGCIYAADAELLGPGYRNFGDLAAAAFRKYELDFEKLNRNYTYSFEICSPANKVVLTYPEIKLFHILTVDNTTLQEIEIDIGIPKPQNFGCGTREDFQKIVDNFNENCEGIVIKDAQNRRVKLKTPLYFELHRMAGNGKLTLGRAIHLIRTNEVEEFLSYFQQYKFYIAELQTTYNLILKALDEIEQEVEILKSNSIERKEFAMIAKSKPYPFLYFKAFDGENLKKFVNNMTDASFIRLFNLKE